MIELHRSQAYAMNYLVDFFCCLLNEYADFFNCVRQFRDNLPRAMELTDAFGQITQLTFVTIERNPALAPALFRFELPAGADVVGEPPK